jgi:hypothetical protein
MLKNERKLNEYTKEEILEMVKASLLCAQKILVDLRKRRKDVDTEETRIECEEVCRSMLMVARIAGCFEEISRELVISDPELRKALEEISGE